MNPSTFPKPHLVLTGALTLLMTAFAVDQFSSDERDRFTTEAVLLKLPALEARSDSARDHAAAAELIPEPESAETAVAVRAPLDASPGIPASALPSPAGQRPTPLLTGSAATTALLSVTDPGTLKLEPTPLTRLSHETSSIEVRPGDNLSVIFKRQGLPARDIQNLIASKPFGQRLKSIFPGHTLSFTRADDGTLVKLAYTPGPLETLEFERIGESFVGREMLQDPARTTAYKHGKIDHSLFVASQRAGLPDSVTMRLAQIFQWDVDFVLDIRRGDEFHVVYEELYVGEEFVGYGEILAAEFVNRGESFRAIRYTDSHGKSDYYDPQGDSMRKAATRRRAG